MQNGPDSLIRFDLSQLQSKYGSIVLNQFNSTNSESPIIQYTYTDIFIDCNDSPKLKCLKSDFNLHNNNIYSLGEE